MNKLEAEATDVIRKTMREWDASNIISDQASLIARALLQKGLLKNPDECSGPMVFDRLSMTEEELAEAARLRQLPKGPVRCGLIEIENHIFNAMREFLRGNVTGDWDLNKIRGEVYACLGVIRQIYPQVQGED